MEEKFRKLVVHNLRSSSDEIWNGPPYKRVRDRRKRQTTPGGYMAGLTSEGTYTRGMGGPQWADLHTAHQNPKFYTELFTGVSPVFSPESLITVFLSPGCALGQLLVQGRQAEGGSSLQVPGSDQPQSSLPGELPQQKATYYVGLEAEVTIQLSSLKTNK